MSEPSGRIPVLFDTDIGSDIDDALALAYLLAEPRCELLGVTTVTGEPERRAGLADAMCRAAGRADVPIHSGCPEPFLVARHQPLAPQASVLPRWPHRAGFPPATAVPFMQRVIRERPGEVALLAVGPFTNVGVLFAMDPEIPSLLRELVIMGGVYTTSVAGAPRREWNAQGDPHATARMFAAPVPVTTAFGLEVTLRCRLEAAECRRRLRGGPLALAAEMAEVWFERRAEITFHDPLAAVGLFDPGVCEYETGRVEVEFQSSRVAGATYFTPAMEGPHRVAVQVDPDRFFTRYFDTAGTLVPLAP